MKYSVIYTLATVLAGVSAVPVERRAAGCSKYTIIDTRGTGEAQGPSAGFRTMNSNIMSQVSGGEEYDTKYPAGADQNSSQGTADIVNKVQSTLQSDPEHCFILEGYSQGAAATVAALPKLTGDSFDAVKGVFLIGDPMHKAGLACNVDVNGGQSTANANGMEATMGSIPDEWVSKTMDVCNQGDGVCDTASGAGITPQHLAYPTNQNVQKMGTDFVVKALTGSGSDSGSASASGSSSAPTASASSGSSSGSGSGSGGFGSGGFGSGSGFPSGGSGGFGSGTGSGAGTGGFGSGGFGSGSA